MRSVSSDSRRPLRRLERPEATAAGKRLRVERDDDLDVPPRAGAWSPGPRKGGQTGEHEDEKKSDPLQKRHRREEDDRRLELVSRADVAELVDAHGSGPCGGDPVEVQVLSSAPKSASGV